MLPKRATAALFITGGALALLLNFKTPEATVTTIGGSGGTTGSTTTVANAGSAGSTASTASASASTGSSSSSTTTSTTSGTITGSAVQTRYGTVQIQLTVASGKITNVQVLQYPSDNPRSQSINQSALPTLIQETLQAQSAQINAVSGATYTSQGYTQSLQSAIDQMNA